MSEAASQVLDTARRLQRLLEQEFDALKNRDLPQLEKLTETREALLSQLLYFRQTQESLWKGASFDAVRTLVAECQSLHKRNELLLARQLDGIRRTLGALQKSSDDEDLYDRLGQLARRRSRLFTDDA